MNIEIFTFSGSFDCHLTFLTRVFLTELAVVPAVRRPGPPAEVPAPPALRSG